MTLSSRQNGELSANRGDASLYNVLRPVVHVIIASSSLDCDARNLALKKGKRRCRHAVDVTQRTSGNVIEMKLRRNKFQTIDFDGV